MSDVRSGEDNHAPQSRGNHRGEDEIEQKPPSTTSAQAAPSSARGSSHGRGSNHVDGTNKRIGGGTSGPKRATRASTGAHITLTAKGSLYKAHKDTGECSGLGFELTSSLGVGIRARRSRPSQISHFSFLYVTNTKQACLRTPSYMSTPLRYSSPTYVVIDQLITWRARG